MNQRRNQLKSLLSDLGASAARAPDSAQPPTPSATAAPEHERAVSGSIKAMRLSLGDLGARAAEAQTLRAQIAQGEHAVPIDPDLLSPSFVADRLTFDEAWENDSDLRAFVADVRDHGQQSPILARPDPLTPGRYQIAYGHRRWRAAKILGRPVLALVRELSDDQLVVAQGQENAQRRDLSFIEKAFFAQALDIKGFERATLMAALAVQTAEISRLLTVARAVPREIAAAIGPAPKVGRPRWLALARFLAEADAHERVLRVLQAEKTLDSDARFARAFDAASQTKSPKKHFSRIVLANPEGDPLVMLTRRGNKAFFAIDETRAPKITQAIADFLERQPVG